MSKGRTESTAKPLTDDLTSPRFPPPPRTPSLAGALRSASGTQPRAMIESPAAANETASQGGEGSALGHGFADEAPSFDKRLTPVVAASWPDQEAVTATNARVLPEAAGAVASPAEPHPMHAGQPVAPPSEIVASSVSAAPVSTPTAAMTPSQPSIAISLSPSAGEHAFWDGAPQYSVPPPHLITEPPPPKPSLLRTSLARILFTAIAGVAMALLYYEATIAYHVPWQSPAQLVERLRSR